MWLVGSVLVAPGLKGVTESVVVAHRLSYPEACGVFLDQESNPCKSLAWADRFFTREALQ